MPDPTSPSSMTSEDVEKEIQELKRIEQMEELRRLRARAGTIDRTSTSVGQGSEGTRTMVSERILPPPNLEECSTYDMYKKRLQLWELGMDISKKKKAAMLIQSLTNHSKFKRNLADKFLEQHSAEDLANDEALDLVKDYLDKELDKPEINKAVDKWNEFEECRKLSSESYEGYLDRFERAYTAVQSASKVSLPQDIRSFMFLARAGIVGVNRTIVMSKLDIDKKETLFDQLGKVVKETLGGPGQKAGTSEAVIKCEENVLWVGDKKFKLVKKRRKKVKNKKDNDGKTMKCFDCESEYHFAKDPDCKKVKGGGGKEKKEAKKKRRSSSSSSSEESVNMIQEIMVTADEVSNFTWEARGAAALDSCCTSSVTGKAWLDMFKEDLDEDIKKQIKGPYRSDKVFGFGNNGQLESLGKYYIPVVMAGWKTNISVDLIDSDIPLLLSRKAMEKAKMKIDFAERTVTAFGRTVPMQSTQSGHPILPIQPQTRDSLEQIFAVIKFDSASRSEQRKGMRRIHRQFGHIPKSAFLSFLRSTRVKWHPEMEQDLEEIMENCAGCLMRKRNPDKPAVAMPMAHGFNEKLAIDLKVWDKSKNIYLLYMVDMWSRLTQAAVIRSKKPRAVVDKILQNWVTHYGLCSALVSDNGGEFTGEEMVEMRELMNMEDVTTAGYAPWMNGVCEKHHATVDVMLEAMVRDHPTYSLETLLAWACMVKNTTYDQYGFTPNQLVFGMNPKLPNVFTEGLPSLEGVTTSETLAKHINSLHSARKAFTESQASAKLRLALKKKIRTNNEVYQPGDKVYWKMTMDKRWRGPGRVVLQDGKIVFIRNGPRLIRTSVNRTVKVGEEFGKKEEIGDSLGDREAVEARSTENNESPEDEDMGEMWEEVTIEEEEAHDWNTGEARIIEKNTQLLTDVPEAAEEVNNDVDDFQPTVSPSESEASWLQSEASASPGPSSQGGLGEEGGQVGTTAPSGPRPLRGSGVTQNIEVEDAIDTREAEQPEPSPSSQGGLGEEGGWVGTTTPSGPSPLRGSGVPQDSDKDYAAESMEAEEPDPNTREIVTTDGRKKRVRMEANSRQVRPKTQSKLIKFPKNNKPKIALKEGENIRITLEGEEVTARVTGRCKVTGSFYNYFNIKDQRGLDWNVNLEVNDWSRTQEEVMMVLIPRSRHGESDCKSAKQTELKKLQDFGAFSLVKDEGQFRISCTWVLWVKEHSDGQSEVRARLVARGYEEEEEVPSDSPTVDHVNIRILLAIAAANKWPVMTSDVKSAFLQGRELSRTVLLKPPREAGAPAGMLWRLNVALYGLDDASLQFHFKCKEVFEKMDLQQSKLDPAMFYEADEQGKLTRALVTHVDDFLHIGSNENQKKLTSRLGSVFEMGKVEKHKFKYLGYQISQDEENFAVKIDQAEYANKLEIVKIHPERKKDPKQKLNAEEKTLMKQISGRIGWLGRGTRPDLLFHQVEVSTKFVSGEVGDLVQGVKALRKAGLHDSFIMVKSLGRYEDWYIEAYTDASHGNLNNGVDSTGAVVILLRSGTVAVPLLWYVNKVKRVCNSSTEAETLTLSGGVDQAIYVREVLEELLGIGSKQMKVKVIVDSKDTYDTIHSTVASDNRRLRSEVSRIKESLNTGEISALTWRPGKEMLADCLTKRTASGADLLEVFQTGEKK